MNRTGTILCSLCLVGTALCAAADLELAGGGRTPYRIVVDPAATIAEKHAAAELARFLKQVTGAEFAIETGTAAGPGPTIIVGPGAATGALAPDLKLDQLSPDGIVIEARGRHLILAGDRPRGTLYAVYTFLEDTVGCRWWSSKASFVPRKPSLRVPPPHVRYVPPLEYRETFWWDAFDPDWAVRNKSNANRARLDEKRGGHITYKGFVHTFNSLVPPKTYFKQHPEWFSEIDGKRLGGNGERVQLCLTNQALKDFVTQRVLEWLKESPNANIVSVSQNDWGGRCQCAQCKALEEAEGSPAGPMLLFVNYVAERVGKRYPDVAISTLAYHYTRKPPLHVKPLPNVIVRLCSIECNFLRPLGTDPSNIKFRQDIEGWNRICKRLYIWDYTTNFAHYIMPHPNLRVLAPNIRFFVAHGVKGVFEQGAYQSPGAEFAELRAWVLAKLLWDPSRDPQALIDEFVTGYYGAAAPYIRQYIRILHDTAEKSGAPLRISASPNAPFFTLDFLAAAEGLFRQAEAAAAGDPDVLNRVQVARLPVRYLWAVRWYDFQGEARRRRLPWPGPADYVENAKTFMAIARRNHVTKLSEGRSIDSFARRTIALGRRTSTPPPGCEKLPMERWIDLQDATFNLWREGSGAKLIHDPKASDGVAAWMPGTHHEWAVQQRLNVAGIDPKAAYTCYASIRCEKTGDEGLAFSFGLYDITNRRSAGSGQVVCKELPDAEYHTYKIAETKLHGGMYLWVAPPKNPENVKSVCVDRFWLVENKPAKP